MSCKRHKERTIIWASQSFFISVCVTKQTGEGEISSQTVNRWDSQSPQCAAGLRSVSISPSTATNGPPSHSSPALGGRRGRHLLWHSVMMKSSTHRTPLVFITQKTFTCTIVYWALRPVGSPNFQRRARCGQMCCWSRPESSRWASTVSLIACFELISVIAHYAKPDT